MRKVGRNDSCPCGSGKKHKKCCMNNVIPFVPVHLEKELETLRNDLFTFAEERYETELNEMIEMDLDEYMDGTTDKDKDGYVSLNYPWYIFNESVNEEADTIYDMFVEENIEKITSDQVKEVFLSWKNSLSFMYEIVSVPKENEIIVRDMTLDKTYPVILPKINESHIGSYLIGTLIPFISTNQFLHVTAALPKEAKGNIEVVVEEFENDSSFVNAVFPEFVAHFYAMMDTGALAWAERIYEEIADKLLYHLEQKNREDNPINFILAFWHYYSTKHTPRISKMNTYIAALEYLVSEIHYPEDSITQTKLAKEYGVSAGTISNHYQKMMTEVEAFSKEIQ